MTHPTHPSLGRKGKDRISGFAGTITGFAQYLTGCNQLLLIPGVDDKGGHRDGQWYDEQRVELEPGQPIVLENGATPGSDKPAPIR